MSPGSRTPTAISPCTAIASCRTTTTGQAARVAAYLLTEPRIIAVNPPAPRAPTTSMAASVPLATTARAGGPDSRTVAAARPGATSSTRARAVSIARSEIPRSATATVAADA